MPPDFHFIEVLLINTLINRICIQPVETSRIPVEKIYIPLTDARII